MARSAAVWWRVAPTRRNFHGASWIFAKVCTNNRSCGEGGSTAAPDPSEKAPARTIGTSCRLVVRRGAGPMRDGDAQGEGVAIQQRACPGQRVPSHLMTNSSLMRVCCSPGCSGLRNLVTAHTSTHTDSVPAAARGDWRCQFGGQCACREALVFSRGTTATAVLSLSLPVGEI